MPVSLKVLKVREKVVQLRNQGLTWAEVAKKTKMPMRAAQNTHHNFKSIHSVLDRPRSGRRRIPTSRQDRALVTAMRKNEVPSAEELTREYVRIDDTKISVSTTRRRLGTMNMKCLPTGCAQFLSVPQISVRSRLATKVKPMGKNAMGSYIFTYEASLWL